MSAIRVARGVTARDRIIKFIGCYHGHSDSLLVSAGSGLATFGTPSSPGVTSATAEKTIALPFNDVEALRSAFSQYGETIAAVILEVLPCNMGMIQPTEAFLTCLQEQTSEAGALLIADEVLTGLRVTSGGAYHYFDVKPDLVTVGKVIGGGFPLAAYGGKAKWMQQLSPEGPIYQAGTLSGNPVATAAGLATVQILQEQSPYTTLSDTTSQLCDGITQLATKAGRAVVCQSLGSLFSIAFSDSIPTNFDDIAAADHDFFAKFFWGMLEQGIYLAPSGYEVGFVSTAHTTSELDKTLTAVESVFKAL